MCRICTGEYDENTIALYCYSCKQVTSIPDTLVKLRNLFCDNTKVTSIPSTLVSLRILDCENTSILFIPNLPSLEVVYCDNTPVTCIPLGLQYSSSNNCPWLEIENISKLIPIQKRFKNKFKTRRVKELDKYFYPDIVSLIL
jgi:Leucine-rich repeat (LRR) protein